MSEQIKDKIQALRVQNFTCFEDVSFDFSGGINVFIGENGTGKTHILKLLYALTGNSDERHNSGGEKIDDVFKSTTDQYFNRKSIVGEIKITKNSEDFLFSFGFYEHEMESAKYKKAVLYYFVPVVYNEQSNIDEVLLNNHVKNLEQKLKKLYSSSLFIPCAEMLSLYPGFISAYNKRENSFDGTHYDLALALNANPLKNSALKEAEELSDILEKALNIKVIMENDKFYIVFKEDNNRKVAAPLAAEGIKKLGQMIYLIRNGSLTKETILIWDEPEINLNPKYIRLVADFLMALARQGVQIFVATHDYLLTQYLSIKTEYHEATHAPPMQFFSFYKTENGTKIEAGDTLSTIQNNVILDEYAALYELEGNLFQETMKK